MKTKPPRQFSRAWQTLAGSQVVAQDAQNDLGHQLFADRNFTSPGEPELHEGTIQRLDELELTSYAGCHNRANRK
jgi:hypothetical protein